MSFEPIGLATLLAGIVCSIHGSRAVLALFMCSMLLGAAAAAFVPALGGANIQPAHFLLAVLFADLILRPALLAEGRSAFGFPRPGFWLLVTALYGLGLTLIMPRLFAGATYVFTPARLDSGAASVLSVPLGPSGANITQSIYFAGDVICFLLAHVYGDRPRASDNVVGGIVVFGAANLIFVLLDLVTYYTNSAEILSFIRNSSYRMLDDVETAGLKRIVGSFTEAAAFAYITLAIAAFTLRLWSEGIAARRTGPIACLSILAVVFATSSTGYAGLVALLTIQFCLAAVRLLKGRAAPNTAAFLGLGPLFCAVLVSAVLLSPQARISIGDLIDTTLFNKFSSDSGLERGAWNRQAIEVLRDTSWLGAGIGSLRASSWLLAVPASIGLIGAALYGAFVVAVLFGRHADDDAVGRAVRAGARDACLIQIIAASVAGSFIDLGLAFFLFAGLSSSNLPSAATVARRSPGRDGRDLSPSRPTFPLSDFALGHRPAGSVRPEGSLA